MEVSINNCPICQSTERELILDFNKSLQFIHNKYISFGMSKYFCLYCGHIYSTEYNKSLLEDHYESTRDAEEGLIYNVQEDLDVTFIDLIEWMHIEGNIKSSSIKRILDIGCGKCDLLKTFSLKYNEAEYFGIDYSTKSMEYGKEKGIENIIVGDIYSESFGGHRFDIISATGVLEHQTDISAFMKKVSSLLNEQGLLIIQVPDSLSILKDYKAKKSKFMHDICNEEHLHHFDSDNLIKHISNFGYEYVNHRSKMRGMWEITDLLMKKSETKISEQIIQKKVVDDGIKQFEGKRQNYKHKLMNLLRQDRRFGLYGAGWHTTQVLTTFYEIEFDRIEVIFDQDPRKNGLQIYGVNIEFPQREKVLEMDIIIISSINVGGQIKQYLQQCGFPENNIVELYD